MLRRTEGGPLHVILLDTLIAAPYLAVLIVGIFGDAHLLTTPGSAGSLAWLMVVFGIGCLLIGTTAARAEKELRRRITTAARVLAGAGAVLCLVQVVEAVAPRF